MAATRFPFPSTLYNSPFSVMAFVLVTKTSEKNALRYISFNCSAEIPFSYLSRNSYCPSRKKSITPASKSVIEPPTVTVSSSSIRSFKISNASWVLSAHSQYMLLSLNACAVRSMRSLTISNLFLSMSFPPFFIYLHL